MELVNVSRVVPVVDEYGLSLCSIVVVEKCENLEVKLFLKNTFFSMKEYLNITIII